MDFEVRKRHDGFDTIRFEDGTFGYRTARGEVRGGFKSPSGATLSAKSAIAKAGREAASSPDPASATADEELRRYADRIRGVYSRAESEMRDKQARAMERYESKRDEWETRVASGAATREEFDAWLRGQSTLQGRMIGLTEDLARTAAGADAEAVRMLSDGHLSGAYAEGMNFATYQVESGAGVSTSFTLYDRATVDRLLRDGMTPLTDRGTDPRKDLAWNRRKIQGEVLQGILQGESSDDVAKRLRNVLDMDRRVALRTARTALTAAQNAGRVDAYARAEEMGIDLVQEWQATYDMRTRHTHAVLDGEQVKVGGTFSNGLRYPGDPKGPPSEVMNCRCTLVPVLGGLDDGGEWKKDVRVGDMSYEEWKARHAERADRDADRAAEGVPPLLRGFRDHTESFLSDHAAETGMTGEQLDDLASMVQSMYDQSEVYCTVGEEVIEDMLGGGHLKNAMEVSEQGRDIGKAYLEARRKISQYLYGKDSSGMSPSDFEKYGYIGSSDPLKAVTHGGAVGMYGSISLRMDKGRLRDRVTYTFGDSLNKMQDGTVMTAGGLEDDLSVTGIGVRSMGSVYKRMKQVQRKTGGLDGTDVADRCVGKKWYIEAQVHGEVTIDDVAEVMVRCTNTSRGIGYATTSDRHESIKRQIDALEDRGVKVTRYIERYEKDPATGKWGTTVGRLNRDDVV